MITSATYRFACASIIAPFADVPARCQNAQFVYEPFALILNFGAKKLAWMFALGFIQDTVERQRPARFECAASGILVAVRQRRNCAGSQQTGDQDADPHGRFRPVTMAQGRFSRCLTLSYRAAATWVQTRASPR